ncbi:MAG: NUDIX domain-containing protein [Simkaniaceae bacterium]|nr:MAG: NUDIX domain-containing protein [Simkaniaceae bacterium]
MYKNLIEEALSEGMEKIAIETVIEKDGKVLLIEDLGMGTTFYGFPKVELKEGESIPQALQRAVTERTAMQLKDVKRYLGHYDRDGMRHYHFVVEVNDPYSLEENANIAYAWLDVQEAVGYPITDQLREMLDLYNKT